MSGEAAQYCERRSNSALKNIFGPAVRCLLLVALLAATCAATPPYRELSAHGADFLGPGRQRAAPDTLTAIRLGLIGPQRGSAGQHLRHAVELAVVEANERGGFNGLPFAVAFRADDGPWSQVARQVVRLAQEDEVWAIVGALNGERAHAAELVVAKLWVPVLTPGAGDLSIDYANVPWVFRLLPSNRAQAELLLAAAAERGWRRIALLSEGTRDARQATAHLRRASAELRQPLALLLEYDPVAPLDILPRLEDQPIDALVVWGRAESATALIKALRQRGVHLPALVPAQLYLPEVAAQGDALGEVLCAAPASPVADSTQHAAFAARFRQRSGQEPSYIAVCAYDAARLALNAINRVGLNRVRIRDALAATDTHGLSGPLSFDTLGGRRLQPILMHLGREGWTPP